MARTLTVSKVEATRTRQRQLLRQAAWTESAARFWHGQVVDMDGRLARLQLEDRPHPGVIIRFYDFQFGMFGLSILHFAPFGVQQQMTWLNAGGANMQNFSAAETAPRPPVASSMGDLVDAARMLCRYGQEFFAQPVRDVLEELLDFAQQLDG
ncbi:hypothetical protein PF011_g13677 [Phytophthora fragariae]|uniref:Uncharacterized protein n=1 Tax=Phytophthora fragariae TaxID=53985 RepID=A0A6A3KC38_9STRA|nr:hypothetical protein PF011_g13677 [Phytophthora fragariae]